MLHKRAFATLFYVAISLVACPMLAYTLLCRSVSSAQCIVRATNPVNAVFFVDPSDGWIIYSHAGHDYVARTSDAGRTWTSFTIQSSLSRVYFLTPQVGWAMGVTSTGTGESPNYRLPLFITDDGGKKWTMLSATGFPGKNPMVVSGLLFVDRLRGWIVGDTKLGSSFAYETSDGGKTFAKIRAISDGRENARGISSDGKSRIWVYGSDSVFVSSDRGKSWVRTVRPGTIPGDRSELTLMTAWLFPDGRGAVGGTGATGTILSTLDGGRHWKTTLETKDITNFRGTSFWDDRHGCMVGESTDLYCTSDGGGTWVGRDVLPHYHGPCQSSSNLFTDIILTAAGRGWLRDDGGDLYLTNDGGQSWKQIDPVADLVQ